MGRWGWQELFVSLFIIVAAYVAAFKFWKTQYAWLLSAIACVVIQRAVMLKYDIQFGLDLQRWGIDTIEWFVVGAVAGLIAMLIGNRPPSDDKPKKRTTYY